ncbi:MAG: putative porin [Methylococcaceae bacterium]|nr:putative porin [Methylococcaceae bacterium]
MKLECKPIAAVVACALASHVAKADEKEELLKLRNTTLNLIEMLVEQGVLDKQKAEKMIQQAEKKAVEEAKAEAGKAAQAPLPAETSAAKSKGVVRVTYVPEFVKDEIRQEVRKELRDDVVKEVKSQAKQEKWGVPAALPDWVNRFKPFGDFRVRYEDDFFGSGNLANTYNDWPAINRAGGIGKVGNAYRNTTYDRQRYRIRLRFGLESQIADSLKAVVRLTTSNDRNPISNLQSLGQYGQQYDIALDRAFLQYDYRDGKGRDWLTLWAGRTPNPWLSTDNLFDPDLSFEGFAGTFRLPFGPDTVGAEPIKVPNTSMPQQLNLGYTQPNQVYLTMGGFPLQEKVFQSHGKWLWAAQTGVDWLFSGDSRLKAGFGYYSYENISAIPNVLGSRLDDWTAPQFFTQGNSLARISNDGAPSQEPRLMGLAANFNIVDAVVTYDYSGFAPHNIRLTANYSRNIGFDRGEIFRRTGLDIEPKTQAYQVRLDVGQSDIRQFGDWSAWLAYKYLERDSVLDAFTDSNFHLSGTDAKGWVASLNYGLMKNTWANVRWLSSEVIDGTRNTRTGKKNPYGLDVLLVDVNARF